MVFDMAAELLPTTLIGWLSKRFRFILDLAWNQRLVGIAPKLPGLAVTARGKSLRITS